MYYAISHLTVYKYSDAINDSVMELRMQPRSDGIQRQLRFDLNISPDARAFAYKDYLGNMIHTFDIPALHEKLAIKAESIVEMKDAPFIPEALPQSAWATIDEQAQKRDFYDMLLDGQYARPTPLLEDFASEIDFRRHADPLTLLRELNTSIFNSFDYTQGATRADSPIDEALQTRRGVCQDFTHIMLALVRQMGIPARYVSGYLFHRTDSDRSDEDATHAWLEAWLPDLGWVGFDPTNNLIVGNRHIRVNISNDYANATPSRGVFKGGANTELEVRVQVSQIEDIPFEYEELAPNLVMPKYEYYQAQQQQQQQQ